MWNSRKLTPNLIGWESLSHGPTGLAHQIPLATRLQKLRITFLIHCLIRILTNSWRALTIFNPSMILMIGQTMSTCSWRQCAIHPTWPTSFGRKPNSRSQTWSDGRPYLSVFYSRVYLGIPLGREMIVGDRWDKKHDGTSNIRVRQVRAASIV